MAVAVLADMFTSSLLDAEEFEAERGVILEELAMADDDPSDVVSERFFEAVFGEHPLGRPIGGSPASIGAVDRDAVLAHYRANYRPQDLVISVAGAVDHDQLVALGRDRARDGRLGADARGRSRHAPGRRARPHRSRRTARGRRAADRAGQHPARRRRPRRHRPAPVHARGAQLGAGRRDVVAALPGGAREARPGLLGLLVRRELRRRRARRPLRRMLAQERGQGRRADAGRVPPAGRGRHHRRGARPRAGPARGSVGARPRGLRHPHDPARAQRADVRRVLRPRRGAAPHRGRDRGRRAGARRRARRAAAVARRCRVDRIRARSTASSTPQTPPPEPPDVAVPLPRAARRAAGCRARPPRRTAEPARGPPGAGPRRSARRRPVHRRVDLAAPARAGDRAHHDPEDARARAAAVRPADGLHPVGPRTRHAARLRVVLRRDHPRRDRGGRSADGGCRGRVDDAVTRRPARPADHAQLRRRAGSCARPSGRRSWRWLGLNQANCGLTIIRVRSAKPPVLVTHNDLGHLPPELRSGCRSISRTDR